MYVLDKATGLIGGAINAVFVVSVSHGWMAYKATAK
jgi:hypothetical protein